jgi:hypothetical protein
MSTVRPPVRLQSRRILIGLAAAAAVVALAPTASSAQARHHLVFKLSGPAHQNLVGSEGIAISLHCPLEACTVVASAFSKSPSIHTDQVRTHVAGGTTANLTLPLAPRQNGKLKAALEAGKSPAVTVHATARDSSGNKVSLSLLVRANKL